MNQTITPDTFTADQMRGFVERAARIRVAQSMMRERMKRVREQLAVLYKGTHNTKEAA